MGLSTLRLELVKDTCAVRAYVAYEMRVEGQTIRALLPVNMETS